MKGSTAGALGLSPPVSHQMWLGKKGNQMQMPP
jgi:hypothetical protein